jgi:hypothetical protein
VEPEDALLALAIGFTIITIAVPVLFIVGLSLVDVIFRQDIGFSKLVWLGAFMALPGLGIALYWLFRPKDFDPLNEPRPFEPQLPRYREAAASAPVAVAAAAPAGMLTPALQGGADPEEPDDGREDSAA